MATVLDRIITFRPTGRHWSTILALAIAAALLVLGYSSYQSAGLQAVGSGLILAGASLFSGGLLGFLFGIPRALQVEAPEGGAAGDAGSRPATAAAARYGANTNLEQISDWLTKILVGVGLTQLAALPEHFVRLGDFFGPALALETDQYPMVVALIVLFVIAGFLYAYLWTRIYLGGELARADMASVADKIRSVAAAQEQQSLTDARALSLTTRYLSDENVSGVSVEELRDTVSRASPPVKVQIFYRARDLRTQSWRRNKDKWKVERTIPVFEALIAADRAGRFHRNHAQLGYALKDSRQPDFARAEQELTRAIEMRGPPLRSGWEMYEFNRAVCRIHLDKEFNAGKKSKAVNREAILADLRVALRNAPDLRDDATVAGWLGLNEITDIGPPADDQNPDI